MERLTIKLTILWYTGDGIQIFLMSDHSWQHTVIPLSGGGKSHGETGSE
jgi:hypothetical protein